MRVCDTMVTHVTTVRVRDTRTSGVGTMPKVKSISKVGSMAGRTTYRSVIEYPDESAYTVLFHGDTVGSDNVVMQYESGVAGDVQVWVRNPGRFGVPFGKEWVRRFWQDGRD